MQIGEVNDVERKKRKKKFFVIVSIVVILIATVILFVVRSVHGSVVSTKMEDYENLTEVNSVLPSLTSLEKSEDLKFKHFHKNMILFSSDAYTLTAKYDEEEYAVAKSIVASKYEFQTKPIEESNKTPMFSLDKFDFRVVSFNHFELTYPRKILFIGMSDEKKEIAYVYYEDMDLDHINTSFEEFLKEECGW